MFQRQTLVPLDDRGPLRVMFVITSMPVGGAETLLVELIRRLDRSRFLPELCCLKQLGPLGEMLAVEVPVFSELLSHKRDVAVLWRLKRLMRRRRVDAVVTVGAGDKMFWGRLAAWLAGVPVIASALHSTGMPDCVRLPNRLLAPLTDAFIAVAEPHGRTWPSMKAARRPRSASFPTESTWRSFGRDGRAKRSGKNWDWRPGLRSPASWRRCAPRSITSCFCEPPRWCIVKFPRLGSSSSATVRRRADLETLARELSLSEAVRFLGTRSDVPELLSLVDVMLLTSHMEANPVSIMEAMATEKPVVATRVGSVGETVLEGRTGYLVAPGAAEEMAGRVVALLRDHALAATMGRAGREHVLTHWSIERMVEGYQDLIAGIYASKCRRRAIKGSPCGAGPAEGVGLGVERLER